MTEAEVHQEPWDILRGLIHEGNVSAVTGFLEGLSTGETARAISRLDADTQNQLLVLLEPADAANLIEELPNAQAADLIEELPEEQAAAIVDELPSDQQADLLGALTEEGAEAILKEMDPEEAKDARSLLSYPEDAAGGLMITEYLSYAEDAKIEDILEDLRVNAETYAAFEVLYAYIKNSDKELVGVVNLRDLLLAKRDAPIRSMMTMEPVRAHTDTSLEDLRDIFDRNDFFGLPVVDNQDRLVGVVRRGSVREALETRSEKNFLQASGILGGEELRSFPMRTRTVRRFSFLAIKIGLNIISASVIAAFSDTLAASVALALFLPIISDMGGVAGNQALAVTIREMALGILKPKDVVMVLLNEVRLGIFLGILLGVIIALVAWAWQANPYLGLVVGVALAMNTIIAVGMGATMPLIFKRLNIDPAVAASGMLTFITDAVGFFMVLAFATVILSKLTPVP